MAKAFSPTRSPIVGAAMNTGPSSAPEAAARPEPSAKVAVFTQPTRTPISAAVSGSWKVARIAMPARVRSSASQKPSSRQHATTSTKSRSGSTETGPNTSGEPSNGLGISLATPPQANISRFCSTSMAPIITSITLSMSAFRSRRSSSNSSSAPSATPASVASTSATKKFTPARLTSP